MNADNRKKVRRIVEEEGWTVIWVGADMPCEFLDEPVYLLYEDMDGYPCICEAIYTFDREPYYYRPYFKRKDGARMVNCIAWKARADDGKID